MKEIKSRTRVRLAKEHFFFLKEFGGSQEDRIILRFLSQGKRMEPERRRTPRFPFTATVELVEANSGAKSTLKVSELSVNGCYVETPNVLEKGSGVLVKIYREPHYFEAPATVMYVNPSQGMGLMFHDVKPFFAGVLQKWLLAAMVRRKVPQA